MFFSWLPSIVSPKHRYCKMGSLHLTVVSSIHDHWTSWWEISCRKRIGCIHYFSTCIEFAPMVLWRLMIKNEGIHFIEPPLPDPVSCTCVGSVTCDTGSATWSFFRLETVTSSETHGNSMATTLVQPDSNPPFVWCSVFLCQPASFGFGGGGKGRRMADIEGRLGFTGACGTCQVLPFEVGSFGHKSASEGRGEDLAAYKKQICQCEANIFIYIINFVCINFVYKSTVWKNPFDLTITTSVFAASLGCPKRSSWITRTQQKCNRNSRCFGSGRFGRSFFIVSTVSKPQLGVNLQFFLKIQICLANWVVPYWAVLQLTPHEEPEVPQGKSKWKLAWIAWI